MSLRHFFSLSIAFSCVFFLPAAAGHGGGSLDNGTCFVEMGDFHIGLVGYQPEQHPKEKFCAAYPDLGATVLTFDLVDQEAREMKTGVKIVEAESLDQSGADGQSQPETTLASEEPIVRPKGLMTISHNFKTPGNFVALVSIIDDRGNTRTGTFPFTVGATFNQSALILLGAALLFLVWRLVSRMHARPKAAAS